MSSDFNFIGPLKEALRGRKFSGDHEMKESAQENVKAERRTLNALTYKTII